MRSVGSGKSFAEGLNAVDTDMSALSSPSDVDGDIELVSLS